MDALIKLIIFVSMMLLGFFFGRRAERKHYQSILAREEALRHILLTSVKEPPAELQNAQLVMGSVVVASDYFKQFVAWVWFLNGTQSGKHASFAAWTKQGAARWPEPCLPQQWF